MAETQEWRALIPIRVGDVLEGFCGGHFGRDAHGDKRVEAVGADWVVARLVEPCGGSGVFLYIGEPEYLCQFRRNAK